MRFVLWLLPGAAADVYHSDHWHFASKQTLSPVAGPGAAPCSSPWASSVFALALDHSRLMSVRLLLLKVCWLLLRTCRLS